MKERVVSKELYDCLEELIKLEGKEWIIRKQVYKKYLSKTGWATEKYKPLNDLSLDDLADLLYNGYELEETKEDKLLKEYQLSLLQYHETCDESKRGVCKGVRLTLEVLGIEIKGINK